MGRSKRTSRKDITPPNWNGNAGGVNTSAALAGRARRSFIAEHLLIYNLTQTEIVDALAQAGHINPKTGDPWSIGTVNRDVSILRQEWEEKAAQDYASHMKGQLAKIYAAQGQAWATGDLNNFTRLLEMEMKLTGTSQREMINQNADPVGQGWEVYEVLNAMKVRIEERNRLLGDGPTIDGDAT